MTRSDGRAAGESRPIHIERGFLRNSAGSALYRAGGTTVLVSAQISESVPPFLAGRGLGWLTAEYAMLPGSTPIRKSRGGDGRGTEIQRLIGRSLRAVVDRELLGSRTIHIDADVLEADGGTRTAAITAAFIAVADALRKRFDRLGDRILTTSVAAISAGIVGGVPMLDLAYVEDAAADVDMNVVRLGNGGYVEVQGTGEAGSFDRKQFNALMDLADAGLDRLDRLQRETLGDHWPLA